MSKTHALVTAAAVAIGGLVWTGCQPDNRDTGTSAMDTGGGGSTDSYGTDTNARYRSGGNIGTSVGPGPGAPAAASDSSLYPTTRDTTTVAPGGEGGATAGAPDAGTGGVVGATNNGQGASPGPSGTDSGVGPRTSTRIPPGSVGNNGNNAGNTGTGTTGVTGGGANNGSSGTGR